MRKGNKISLSLLLSLFIIFSLVQPMAHAAGNMADRLYEGQQVDFNDTDDAVSEALPIGFDFSFFGNEYDEAYVTTNGYLMFHDPDSYYRYNGPLPLTEPNNYIAPYFTDLLVDNATVLYATIGEAPNRKFVVQWTNVNHIDNDNSYATIQVILYESTGEVQFQYPQFNLEEDEDDNGENPPLFSLDANQYNLLIGLQDGEAYTNYSIDEANTVAEGQAIRFTPDSEDSSLYTINANANYESLALTIDILLANSPEQLSPAKGTSVNGSLTLSWSSVPDATDYSILIDSKPSFDDPAVIEAGSATSYSLDSLPEGTYYWLVYAYNAVSQRYSQSAISSFTVVYSSGLGFIQLSDITLDRPVNESVYVYNATVPHSVTVTSATYTPTDSKATAVLKLDGEPVNNPISLKVGINTISLDIIAQNGHVQTYEFHITRLAESTSGGGNGGNGSNGGGPVATPSPTPTPTPKPTPTPQPGTEGSIFKGSIQYDQWKNDLSKKVTEANSGSAPASLSDIANHWSKNAIILFTKLGFAAGYEDGSFRPDASITRAEFAKIVSQVFNLQAADHAAGFTDTGSHWAKAAIDALASNGIINGYNDGSFKPNQTITRAEIVAIISRIVDLDKAAGGKNKGFTDTNGSWNEAQIKAAAAAGIVQGRSDGKFQPNVNSTRAEALTILLRVLDLDPQIKALLETLK
ncbi:S-layer homology domain-containing protein [Paenibacillus sp. NPDC058174]|uniref:S-layer homology domain-containing protein n=1 Tax=Paenibacillus sp. NPDC058174 TaxID=3346366 RepID=UPI0036D89692